jgi:hypothetical protein
VGRVHRVGAVGGVPRGVRVPAESVLINSANLLSLPESNLTARSGYAQLQENIQM